MLPFVLLLSSWRVPPFAVPNTRSIIRDPSLAIEAILLYLKPLYNIFCAISSSFTHFFSTLPSAILGLPLYTRMPTVTVYEERTLRVPRVLFWCSSLTSLSTFYPHQHQRYVM
jgi:hypothetical protein